jgi:hypothetical protein
MATEYLIAWAVYALAGMSCCFIWWRLTSLMKQAAWRDLSRGFVVVLIFTPWYAGESPEFFAPAIVVLLMDLLLEGAKSGMKGGVALLIASFLMLLVLTARVFLLRRGNSTGE